MANFYAGKWALGSEARALPSQGRGRWFESTSAHHSVDILKRRQNEKKFGAWEELPNGGRRYWYEVMSHSGCRARYIKEVDLNEKTVRFYQEIYNEEGKVVEMHHKFPVDAGHQHLRKEQ